MRSVTSLRLSEEETKGIRTAANVAGVGTSTFLRAAGIAAALETLRRHSIDRKPNQTMAPKMDRHSEADG